MSKAASSPTARLLQSSRLFSLPRPLPQAGLDNLTSSGMYRSSDTATRPYPTHQAIATPRSSQFRGDWGLKRPLPSKTTRNTSTPHIRIAAQDTAEHITDFSSAADHTQTVQKWLEMGVPIVQKTARRSVSNRDRKPPMSVFSADTTDPANAEFARWKYSGPWVAGMQDGEFGKFLEGAVSGKIPAWRDFLAMFMVEERLAAKRKEAQDNSAPLSLAAQEELKPSLMPEGSEIDKYQKTLRDAHVMEGLSSTLTSLISTFLDAPGMFAGASTARSNPAQTAKLQALVQRLDDDSDAADAAPPSTHPAAGLSHLLTNAIMENHPLHGPQGHRSPVLGRVVRPRTAAQGTEMQAKIGVGGIVANDPVSTSFKSSRSQARAGGLQQYDPDLMAGQLDPDMKGGNKMWVHPQSASIDDKGRIRLDVTRGDREAIAVKTGDVEAIHEGRRASSRILSASNAAAFARSSIPPGTAGNANYGFSLPDRARMQQEQNLNKRRSNVKGFDEDGESAKRIRELLDGGGKRK